MAEYDIDRWRCLLSFSFSNGIIWKIRKQIEKIIPNCWERQRLRHADNVRPFLPSGPLTSSLISPTSCAVFFSTLHELFRDANHGPYHHRLIKGNRTFPKPTIYLDFQGKSDLPEANDLFGFSGKEPSSSLKPHHSLRRYLLPISSSRRNCLLRAFKKNGYELFT